MRRSIRIKLMVILSVMLIALIFLSWIANKTFLPNYYQKHKVYSLSDSYEEVNLITSASDISEESDFTDKIEKIENTYNVNIFILSEISDSYDGRRVLAYIYPIENSFLNDFDRPLKLTDRFRRITNSLQHYIFASPNHNDEFYEVLKTSEDYNVFKSFDKDLDSYFLDLVGYSDENYLVFIRANYENIEESTAIASKFMAILGVVVIIVGSLIMFFISKSFTKPILDLSHIADSMSSLDFTAKYSGIRKDEIGTLGTSINELSYKLEDTISELKSANAQLEHDIRQKIEIDELRKDFLSNVSHELKTPIALIQGYAEGLQENINDDPESRNFYCEVIIDEASKMNNIVGKLLSLNEIEFGKNKLDIQHFDIVAVVRELYSSMTLLAKADNINYVFNEHEPVYVWADESMIEGVITNYLSNAIHYADGPKIVDISFKEMPNDKIRISVFNTGSNIPDEELENIWVKFYKIDKARTREYGGSGIGLSIVKAIMEQHNEAFGVKNHSAGVEFWFELDKKDSIDT